MPPTDEYTNLKISQAKLEAKHDAISERLDEVLEEIREAKIALSKWLSIWFPVIILLAILGNNALPVIMKVIERV